MHKGLNNTESMRRIPVSGPSITNKEIQYVTDAVTNAWYQDANIYHERFEKAFAEYIGTNYAIALPSCTSALHLALLSLGVGPGDEVIVPDITWIASAAPISYVGAKPIFADIDSKTWCISVESISDCITENTKAIIPVDLYGNMPDMEKISELARENNLAIIEDAAEAIGSEYNGRLAGSFGDVGVFSFHGSKTMTTGEGGMLVTNNKEIYERSLFFRDHGRTVGEKMFWNIEIAYKYKMSSMQAALGLAQLERIDELVEKKRQIFKWYHEKLNGYPGITLNYEAENVKNSYWMVTVLIEPNLGMKKEEIIHLLRNNNIDCRPFFYPLSSLPAYSNLDISLKAAKLNKNSYRISSVGINLPCGMDMTKEKVDYVCNTLVSIIKST